ncbi:MAG: hypothetical protein ACMUFK_04275, partial [Thermoplasmatota archaeon]
TRSLFLIMEARELLNWLLLIPESFQSSLLLNPEGFFFRTTCIEVPTIPLTKNNRIRDYLTVFIFPLQSHHEELYGILFFMLMHPVTRREGRYSVSTCVENQLGKIERVMHHCSRLMNTKRVELDFVFSRGTYNRGVKIADIIAYSGHVLKEKYIHDIQNYRRIKRDIPDWHISRIFSKK